MKKEAAIYAQKRRHASRRNPLYLPL